MFDMQLSTQRASHSALFFYPSECESSLLTSQLTHLDFFQLHNLESILGDLRGSSSDFYPDQAGGANDAGSKPQGCLDDSLQGECRAYGK